MEHKSLYGSRLSVLLLVFASLTLVHIVLSKICVEVHCIEGVIFLARTISKALDISSDDIFVMPSLKYIM